MRKSLKLFADAIPSPAAKDPIAWMEENVRMIGSALSERMNFNLTPYVRRPVERAALGKFRVGTFVKPVQSGGSGGSEAYACYVLANEVGGFNFQWNWEDDDKASNRWEERIEKILKGCKPLMRKCRSVSNTDKWKKGSIISPQWNLIVQGVWNSKNVDSATVRFQINEEIHNWKAGRMAKADGRLTAVWNALQLNISNASRKGDQLNQKFDQGTQEHWMILCPHCRRHHVLRTRWDKARPDLGGLRYDADGCRLGNGYYDYGKLAPTIRYQMPCGGEVPDDRAIRRTMNAGGKYSEPTNRGAAVRTESWILEAVSVDYIPWVTLIQEKHAALRSLRLGDPEPWWRYLAERECKFYDPDEDRPVVHEISISATTTKNRDGLKDRVARFGALDYQRGTLGKGEAPHWWGLIRDVKENGDSLLVWEGKLLTDEDAARVMREHGVGGSFVLVDTGHDARHVYQFCLRHGFDAVKGSGESFFSHPDDEGRKIFSVERPIWSMCNLSGPTRDDPREEPMFFHYSKTGIRERLLWWRGTSNWQVPGDVSDDYKKHMESEEEVEDRHPITGEVRRKWVQRRERNDIYVLECYVALNVERAGIIQAPQPER